MAEKSKANTKVTRIKATDDSTSKASTRAKAAKPAEIVSKKATKAPVKNKKSAKVSTANANVAPAEPSKNVFARIGGYFKGAWVELKQVRWPTRKATWSLTLAVLLFSAFFVVLILLLDALFQFIFKTIIA